MTITSGCLEFSVGKDFADCVSGKAVSHGTVRTDGMTYQKSWRSTLDQETTYKAFVKAASDEGRRVVFFRSQAMA